MPEEAPTEILWPVMLAGLFAVALGSAMIVARERLARFFVDAHQAFFGERTARIRRATTPAVLIPLGIGWILIGLVGIAMAVFAPEAF